MSTSTYRILCNKIPGFKDDGFGGTDDCLEKEFQSISDALTTKEHLEWSQAQQVAMAEGEELAKFVTTILDDVCRMSIPEDIRSRVVVAISKRGLEFARKKTIKTNKMENMEK